MALPRFIAAAVGLTAALIGNVEANEPCGYGDLTGQPFGTCAPNRRGPIPATLDELLSALDQRLPKVLRDRCTEDENSLCDCILERELEECWSFQATRTPLVKWFSDQGVTTIRGIAELSIVWLKRRIHGQKLRIDEEIARYLSANKEREARYNLGVGSGTRGWPLGVPNDPDGFMQMNLGEGIPRYERFLYYMVEHAGGKLMDCWRSIPLRHPGFAIDVLMQLSLVPKTGKWLARVEGNTLPAEFGECVAGALSGVELPGYGPGPYEVTIAGSRETRTSSSTDPENPGLFQSRLLWLGLGLVLTAGVAAVFVLRRRHRQRASQRA